MEVKNHASYTVSNVTADGLVTHKVSSPADMALTYRKTSNISRTLVGDEIVDNSDEVGASPDGAAPTTSSFSTEHLASMD